MKLFLYRLSLTEAKQASLFDEEIDTQSRKEFLARKFAKPFSFDHWGGIRLRYHPVQNDSGIITGVVCRWISEDAEADPEDPFNVVDSGRWVKAAFFLDTNDDRQIFAFENRQGVGSPEAVVGGLVRHLNDETNGFPFKIDAFALTRQGSFYEAVDSFPGLITSVTFHLVIPNPLNAEEDTREALRKLGERTGATEVRETLKSNDKIDVGSSYVRGAVEHAERGGGEVSAKSGNTQVYNSKRTVRSIELDEDLRPTGEPKQGLFSRLMDAFRR